MPKESTALCRSRYVANTADFLTTALACSLVFITSEETGDYISAELAEKMLRPGNISIVMLAYFYNIFKACAKSGYYTPFIERIIYTVAVIPVAVYLATIGSAYNNTEETNISASVSGALAISIPYVIRLMLAWNYDRHARAAASRLHDSSTQSERLAELLQTQWHKRRQMDTLSAELALTKSLLASKEKDVADKDSELREIKSKVSLLKLDIRQTVSFFSKDMLEPTIQSVKIAITSSQVENIPMLADGLHSAYTGFSSEIATILSRVFPEEGRVIENTAVAARGHSIGHRK